MLQLVLADLARFGYAVLMRKRRIRGAISVGRFFWLSDALRGYARERCVIGFCECARLRIGDFSVLAIYRLSVQNISRGKGRSSVSAAAYRSGEKLRDERTGEIYHFPDKGRIFGCEILTPADAPGWTQSRAELWNKVENSEKRKDSRLAKEVLVSIPAELGNVDRVGLVKNFAKECFVKAGQIADIAFHNFKGKGDHNPHAHIMLTTRDLEEKGFGKKNRFWDTRKWIQNIREAWEKTTNWVLERAGLQERIDHRSLKDRGINRSPQIKLTDAALQMERKGVRTEKGDRYREIEALNKARKEVEEAEAELRALLSQNELLEGRDWTKPFEVESIRLGHKETPREVRELKQRNKLQDFVGSPEIELKFTTPEILEEVEAESEEEEEKGSGPER